jgi:hypothetical protein
LLWQRLGVGGIIFWTDVASDYSFVDCMYCDFSHCTSFCPVELLKKSTVGFQSKSIHYQNWNAGDKTSMVSKEELNLSNYRKELEFFFI